ALITGGGLSENLPRVLPETVAARIDLGSFAALPVFGWLAQTGRLPDAEMLKTFNCGIGMVMVVAKADADALVRLMQEWGEAPYVIGEIVPPGGARTDAKGKGDTWAVQYTGALRYA
ncbi:MAG: AIR synthase-related protein, partial [Hyphomicrobium sp.]|nr:AIR synthase-related protein [Hyphomicrobium sp.]